MKPISYEDVGVIEVEEGIIQFEMKPEHVKLLRNSFIGWFEDGPDVHRYRPFGTMDIHTDMRGILEQPDLSDEHLSKLYLQTGVALQIILRTGKFKTTTYRAPKYTQDWKEYNPTLKGKRKKKDDEPTVPDGWEQPSLDLDISESE